MCEVTKQARLDNWAMFLLSRLQVFFNRTDYCDLTLQFEGNVQLKVHRIIMNACTEYFQLLEQTCEVNDDVLVMPPDLQADVILPIVNFMYTGILEYQHSIFEKLYRTAELMNMSVLLKFLDAQRASRGLHKMSPLARRGVAKPTNEKMPTPLPGRKLPVWKRKTAPTGTPLQINPVKPYSPEPRSAVTDAPLARFDNTPKPTRFEWPDEDIKDIKPFDQLPVATSFDTISYTSKPLLTQEEEMRSTSNSVFDDLRQLPTTKQVRIVKDFKEKENQLNTLDMEDLKSYVKEQKIRSNLADYDDPDDPDYVPDRKRRVPVPSQAAKRLKIEKEREKENKSKVDHSKILTEVLKKYPHLVQKNKNIRLKILAKGTKPDERAPKAKVVQVTAQKILKPASSVEAARKDKDVPVANSIFKKSTAKTEEKTWTCDKCNSNGEPMEFVLYYLYRKHMTDVHHKQFDASDCKHCGAVYEKPLEMAYHMYMVHAVTPPRSVPPFPKCPRCAFVALDTARIRQHDHFHAANPGHAQCVNCKLGFTNQQTLKVHMQLAGHNGKNQLSFDCQYCTRQLNSASSLFVHCRTTHMEDAKRDGMLSLFDLPIATSSTTPTSSSKAVTTPTSDSETSPGASSDTQRHTTTAGNTSSTENLDNLAPFDIVVLENNQQFILQNNHQHVATSQAPTSEHQSFVTLPELQSQTYINQGDISSTDELVMVLTDHDYNDEGNNSIIQNDNSNIVVLYSHPVDGGQQNQFITTSQGNIMLNSETGMLEIHNDALTTSTQGDGETIEMIQKDIEQHRVAAEPLEKTSSEESTPPMQPPALVEGEERKVIAVEREGTGQLINTIEEIEEPDCSFPTEEAPHEEARSDEAHPVEDNLTQDEPMDIDEELPKQDILPTLAPLPEESSQETPPDDSTTTPTTVPLPELGQASSEPAEDIIEMPPMTTVAPSNPTEASEPATQDIVDDKIPENINDSFPGRLETSLPTGVVEVEPVHDESASELWHSGVEPMEVDGKIESKDVVEAPTPVDAISEPASGDKTPQEQSTLQEQVPEESTPVEQLPEEITPEEVVPEKNAHVLEQNIPHSEIAEPIVEPMAPIIDQEALPETPVAEKVEETEKPEKLSEEVSEANVNEPEKVEKEKTPEKTDAEPETVVEASSAASTEPPVSTFSEEDIIEEEDDHSLSTPPLPDLVDESRTKELPPEERAPEEKTKEVVKPRADVGISTLLNDWDDTDSQQSASEQGKGTVNKLINDWEDD